MNHTSTEEESAVHPPAVEVDEALVQVRKKLLDRSALNPLVSFNHGRSKRHIRIVDELPDQITEHLFNGKELTFKSVPEPSKEDVEKWVEAGGEIRGKLPPVELWAKHLKLNVSPDLPIDASNRGARRFVDLKIQTGDYPALLEARLATLYKLARSTIEETGTNFLHLAFGFLEWYESPESDTSRYAPLYTIPVALNKGRLDARTSTYQYSLSLSEEEIQFNASLAARLHEDFGFLLPNIDALNDDSWPEAYLLKIEKKIRKPFPRWKVHRWGTVTLLNFSRLMMYRDLDPVNWPAGESLAEHPLVQAVVSGNGKSGDRSSGGLMPDEHEIDDIDDIHENYPLVDLADSSQHSALIDALDGNNLVIQGPPGTGKSQTITNLIAAAMHKGQTVLFVSEKMAALEVVKQRMERLGLGHFCLELHSHTTKKIGVIESIKQRYEAHFPAPAALDREILHHSELLEDLRSHAARINRQWKNTDLTIQAILVGTTRFRNELDGRFDDLRVIGMDGDKWTSDHHAKLKRDLRAFHGQVEAVAKDIGSRNIGNEHPWRGISAEELDPGSIPEVKERLVRWKEAIARVIGQAELFPKRASVVSPQSSPAEVGATIQAIRRSPSMTGMEGWETLERLNSEGLSWLDRLISAIETLQEQVEALGHLSLDEVETSSELPKLSEAVRLLLETGIPEETALSDLPCLNDSVKLVTGRVTKWTSLLDEYEKFSGGRLPDPLQTPNLSMKSLTGLLHMIELASRLTKEEIKCRSAALLPKEVSEDYPGYRERLQNLRRQWADISERFIIDSVPGREDIACLRVTLDEQSMAKRLLSGAYRSARKEVQSWLCDGKKGWNASAIVENLTELEDFLDDEKAFLDDERWKRSFGIAFNGIETEPEAIDRLIVWHADLAKRFCENNGGLFGDSMLSETGKWLLEGEAKHFEALKKFAGAGLADDVEEIRLGLKKVGNSYGHQELPVETLLCDATSSWKQVLDFLEETLPNLLQLRSLLPERGGLTLQAAASVSVQYLDIRKNWEGLKHAYQELNHELFEDRLPHSPLPTKDVKAAVMPARSWCQWLADEGTPEKLAKTVMENASENFIERLTEWADSSVGLVAAESTTHLDFAELIKLDDNTWTSGGSLAEYQTRAIEAEAAPHMLSAYLGFLRTKGRLRQEGLEAVCDRIEVSDIAVEQMEVVLDFVVLQSLADEIFREVPELRRFDGIRQSETQREFKESDRKILELMRRRMASEISQREVDPGYRGARVSEHTELELLKREMTKQRRHVPLRQLLGRAGQAIQALKPCFMMGPRSVAQYLAPGNLKFDLLVIDEASQMRPADALGAIARCGQLVVVGDSKQLAPTAFFDRLSEAADDEDDQFEAAVSESILDAVEPIFRARQLRWHYRSRHESLIAFSNHQFYDNRLMLFPSPYFGNEALGIHFHYIENGNFENQVNLAEAERIASRAEELLIENPRLSLGVATMNAKQRDLIDRLIERRSKERPQFAKALEENRGEVEPLFVKNLENVQGDEREVMIISCTYGKDAQAGKVHQRFGPINSADGWRRLNVLFTRSRTRMEIYSSMASGDILLGNDSSDGVKALKGMLHFAETKKLQLEIPSGRDPDSDFEIAVASMLKKYGFETAYQIGVAGFFIDLAVKHPAKDHEYLIGIECDGATYHSGKSVRDRDRLRQEILENMGWTIHRIWSTDWFDNPERAIRPILEELAKHGSGRDR